MAVKLFNKIINHMGREYRYCSEKNTLQWVSHIESQWDYQKGTSKIVTLDSPKVVTEIRLSAEQAEKELMHYIEEWHEYLERAINW